MPTKYKNLIFIISEIILIVLFALSVVYVRGCVKASGKKSSGKECSSEGEVKQLSCPGGASGRIFQICKSGKYEESFNDCQQSGCSQVVFDRDVSPILSSSCKSCHPGFDTLEIATQRIDHFIARTSLDDGNVSRMPKAPNEPLSQAEKDIFSGWKDDGLLPSCPDETSIPHIDLNYLEEAMLSDINSLNEGTQAETRWLVMSHKSNEGAKLAELKAFIAAINKGINSISTGRSIVLSKPIDDNKTIYRFNLNDIKLTVAAWNLIEANDPINFESNTNIGALLKGLTNSKKPWMTIDAFLLSANKAQVYYNILKIPAYRDDLLAKEGVNFDAQLDNFQALFVGFANSPISLNKNRLLTRFDSNNGAFWLTFDTNNIAAADKNLFEFPLLKSASGKADFNSDASEAIFGLANGLHAYALFNKAGQRQDAAPLVVVAHNVNPPANPEIKASVSCYRCHHAGFIVKGDEVANAVNETAAQRDLDDVDLVNALYRDPKEAFEKDNLSYVQALAQIGVSPEDPDPVSVAVDNLTERTLDANAVSSLLFLTKEEFIDGLSRSAEGRAQVGSLLTGGSITFSQLVASLPVIYRDLRIGANPI